MSFRKYLCGFSFSLFLLQLNYVRAYLEYDNWVNIELNHAIDNENPNNFIYRGNVTISSLEIGLAKTNQEALTASQRDNLLSLARKNQLYRLKANVVYADGKRHYFLSSTRACNLLSAQLNDILWVSIDSSGSVNSVTVLSAVSDKCSNEDISMSGLEDFNTDVLIRHTEVAPYPDTTTFIQKIEREREARERGEVRDNRGFFAKYDTDPTLPTSEIRENKYIRKIKLFLLTIVALGQGMSTHQVYFRYGTKSNLEKLISLSEAD